MKFFDYKKFVHTFMKIAKLKNYISLNILSICGYIYFIVLYLERLEQAKIYVEPGADGTPEALELTAVSFLALLIFLAICILLVLLSVGEYFIRKRFYPDGILHIRLPKYIEIIHSIFFWIGMYYPVTRLLVAILFVLLYPLNELLPKFS